MTEEKSYYTYMVRCSDNSLYTGFTTDLSHRVSVHNRGKVPVTPVPAFRCVWCGTRNFHRNMTHAV